MVESYSRQTKRQLVCVFDVVFHPDTIRQALINPSLQKTICLLAIDKINEKLKTNSARNKNKSDIDAISTCKFDNNWSNISVSEN